MVHLKLKCLLKKPTHDDIIDAKEVYIQQYFGRYEGKLVLRNLSPSVYNYCLSAHRYDQVYFDRRVQFYTSMRLNYT